MKQLLWRVPDSVYSKIAARAQREGRSINAVATEILDAVADAATGSRRARLRARAALLGLLPPTEQAGPLVPSRVEVLTAGQGIGPVLDQLLVEDREVLPRVTVLVSAGRHPDRADASRLRNDPAATWSRRSFRMIRNFGLETFVAGNGGLARFSTGSARRNLSS